MTHDARDAVTDEIARLRGLLTRCRTVLGNMALENEGATFFRWPISHEPLRADARHLVPLIEEALAAHPSNTTTVVSHEEGNVRDKGDPCAKLGTLPRIIADLTHEVTVHKHGSIRIDLDEVRVILAALKPSDAPDPVKAEMLAALKAWEAAEARTSGASFDLAVKKHEAQERARKMMRAALARASGRA